MSPEPHWSPQAPRSPSPHGHPEPLRSPEPRGPPAPAPRAPRGPTPRMLVPRPSPPHDLDLQAPALTVPGTELLPALLDGDLLARLLQRMRGTIRDSQGPNPQPSPLGAEHSPRSAPGSRGRQRACLTDVPESPPARLPACPCSSLCTPRLHPGFALSPPPPRDLFGPFLPKRILIP